MKTKIKIGVLISGSGSNLQAIIDSCEKEETPAKILFVGSDVAGVKGLERAKNHNIPSFVVDYKAIIKEYPKNAHKLAKDFNLQEVFQKQKIFNKSLEEAKKFLETRVIAENELLSQIQKFEKIDLLVLAGFMRIFTPYFIDKFNNGEMKIMNIHPALLPSFPGTNGYEDTFNYGCKIGGCTVHFVDYGEDTGAIIGQKSFQIKPSDNIDKIKKKGLELEWKLYPECIKLFAEKKLKIETINNRKIVKIL